MISSHTLLLVGRKEPGPGRAIRNGSRAIPGEVHVAHWEEQLTVLQAVRHCGQSVHERDVCFTIPFGERGLHGGAYVGKDFKLVVGLWIIDEKRWHGDPRSQGCEAVPAEVQLGRQTLRQLIELGESVSPRLDENIVVLRIEERSHCVVVECCQPEV